MTSQRRGADGSNPHSQLALPNIPIKLCKKIRGESLRDLTFLEFLV